MSKPIVVACSMDASFGGSLTPSPWHTDAVGGRPPHHPTQLDTAGRALCPRPRIELAFDRPAEGLRFEDHNPRWHTNDVIEFDRPSRTPENDIVKRGEADPL